MKKTLLGLAMAFATTVLLMGCSKEETKLIIGTWAMDVKNSVTQDDYTSPSMSYENTYTVEESEVVACTYSFQDNGVAVVYTDILNEGSFYDTVNYVVEGNKLTMGKDEKYIIASISKKNLVLEDEDDIYDEFDGHYHYKIHYEFTKQK